MSNKEEKLNKILFLYICLLKKRLNSKEWALLRTNKIAENNGIFCYFNGFTFSFRPVRLS